MSILVISPEVAKESAQALAVALGADYENPYDTGTRGFFKHDYLFNYGFSRKTGGTVKKWNKAKAVEIARDKVAFFKAMQDTGLTVPFTEDIKVAKSWITKDKVAAVAREFTKEANGKGVTFCNDTWAVDNVPAKFWTKFTPYTNEFRVNVWKGKVISVYDKIEINDHFTFKLFKGVEEHPQLVSLVKKVHEKVGLDWCGIDVLRDKKGNLVILEVNSAPVLFPYTIKKLVAEVNKEIGK